MLIIFTLTTPQIIDISLSIFALVSLTLYIFLFIRRKIYILPYAIFSLGIVLSYALLGWALLTNILIALYIIFVLIFVTLNATELKAKIDSMFSFGRQSGAMTIVNYDKEMIYELIYDAVSFLSKNKTGALITLERTTKLDAYTKNGVMINAPINAEILTTIFHPGTRLHDGAVIIRGSFILAASVYYQPTTKPMLGKLGSRHRAAIGISETTDAVTIVVSEETGRMSITYGGQIETVYLDSFKKTLANYMENRPHFES
jgi:diadenylate cyclase